MTNDDVLYQKFLFQSLIESSKEFSIIKDSKNSFKLKSITNSKQNFWSYNVNFKLGTLRRVIAYKCHIIYPSGSNRFMTNKFSYYCNIKNKVKKNNNNRFSNETYCKIYDSFDMFKRLLYVEKKYNSKRRFNFIEENNIKYGLNLTRLI